MFFCIKVENDYKMQKKHFIFMKKLQNSVTIHGLADKENPAVIDSGVFAWLIEVPVYF